MTKRNITAEIFKMAFIVVAIPTLANILSRDIKLEKGFLLANLKLYTLAFVVMFVSVSGLMLLFSYILRRRTRSITLLQENCDKLNEKVKVYKRQMQEQVMH